jgi:hypothetical protein
MGSAATRPIPGRPPSPPTCLTAWAVYDLGAGPPLLPMPNPPGDGAHPRGPQPTGGLAGRAGPPGCQLRPTRAPSPPPAHRGLGWRRCWPAARRRCRSSGWRRRWMWSATARPPCANWRWPWSRPRWSGAWSWWERSTAAGGPPAGPLAGQRPPGRPATPSGGDQRSGAGLHGPPRPPIAPRGPGLSRAWSGRGAGCGRPGRCGGGSR